MSGYAKILGDIIKARRLELNLTQSEVAEKNDVDVRTILNIENHKGNPKWEILYPLIRALEIDVSALFYPERNPERDDLTRFYLLLSQCTGGELQALYPICEAVLTALRSNSCMQIENKEK